MQGPLAPLGRPLPELSVDLLHVAIGAHDATQELYRRVLGLVNVEQGRAAELNEERILPGC